MFGFSNHVLMHLRRNFQLLSLMNIHKDTGANLRVPLRNTRREDHEQFQVEQYNPFYKGVELWKLVPLNIAISESLFDFKHRLKVMHQ